MAQGGGEGGFSFQEKKGDLFDCPETDSLVHCVSEDLRMGKGIAVIFKKKFGGIGELASQGKKTGQVAVLNKKGRFIFYLITKPKGSGKPSYASIKASLLDLKKHCVDNNVHQLSMPRIGCGLDRLDWGKVSDMIQEIFEKKTGQVAMLKRGDRYIYYLITKVKATGKPTYNSLKASLKELKKHCIENDVKSLAMPKIGCGLDRLAWEEVSTIICELFHDIDINITAYELD